MEEHHNSLDNESSKELCCDTNMLSDYNDNHDTNEASENAVNDAKKVLHARKEENKATVFTLRYNLTDVPPIPLALFIAVQVRDVLMENFFLNA
jgi:hypothetical protein